MNYSADPISVITAPPFHAVYFVNFTSQCQSGVCNLGYNLDILPTAKMT